MKKLILIIALFLSACAPIIQKMALPATNVPNVYSTIQRCVDSVLACNVAAGTYTEVVKLNKSGVTLQAVGKVVIKGAILIYGDRNIVRGFTLTDKQQKAGIRLYGDGNISENNEIYDTLEDGIWFWGKDNIIRGNYIHDIYDDRNYPAYDNHVDCMMTMTWEAGNSAYSIAENILFENNTCIHARAHGSNQGVMIAGAVKNFTFRNNTFIMSDGADGGYSPAFALYGGSGYVIENNYLCNTGGKGAQVAWIEGASNVTMTGNTWAGYSALVQKSGVATLTNNTKASLPCNQTNTQTPTSTITPTVTITKTLPPPTFTATATKTNTPTPTICYPVRIGDEYIGDFCP